MSDEDHDAIGRKLAELQPFKVIIEEVLELIIEDKIPDEIKIHRKLLIGILGSLTSACPKSTSLQFLLRAEDTLKKFKDRVRPYLRKNKEPGDGVCNQSSGSSPLKLKNEPTSPTGSHSANFHPVGGLKAGPRLTYSPSKQECSVLEPENPRPICHVKPTLTPISLILKQKQPLSLNTRPAAEFRLDDDVSVSEIPVVNPVTLSAVKKEQHSDVLEPVNVKPSSSQQSTVQTSLQTASDKIVQDPIKSENKVTPQHKKDVKPFGSCSSKTFQQNLPNRNLILLQDTQPFGNSSAVQPVFKTQNVARLGQQTLPTLERQTIGEAVQPALKSLPCHQKIQPVNNASLVQPAFTTQNVARLGQQTLPTLEKQTVGETVQPALKTLPHHQKIQPVINASLVQPAFTTQNVARLGQQTLPTLEKQTVGETVQPALKTLPRHQKIQPVINASLVQPAFTTQNVARLGQQTLPTLEKQTVGETVQPALKTLPRHQKIQPVINASLVQPAFTTQNVARLGQQTLPTLEKQTIGEAVTPAVKTLPHHQETQPFVNTSLVQPTLQTRNVVLLSQQDPTPDTKSKVVQTALQTPNIVPLRQVAKPFANSSVVQPTLQTLHTKTEGSRVVQSTLETPLVVIPTQQVANASIVQPALQTRNVVSLGQPAPPPDSISENCRVVQPNLKTRTLVPEMARPIANSGSLDPVKSLYGTPQPIPSLGSSYTVQPISKTGKVLTHQQESRIVSIAGVSAGPQVTLPTRNIVSLRKQVASPNATSDNSRAVKVTTDGDLHIDLLRRQEAPAAESSNSSQVVAKLKNTGPLNLCDETGDPSHPNPMPNPPLHGFKQMILSIIKKLRNETPPVSRPTSPSEEADLMDMAVANCDAATLLYNSRKKLLAKVSIDHIAPDAPSIGNIAESRTTFTEGRRYRKAREDKCRSPSRSSSESASYSRSPRHSRSPNPKTGSRRPLSPVIRYRSRSPKYEPPRLKSPVYEPTHLRSPRNVRSKSPSCARRRSKSPNSVRRRSKSPSGVRRRSRSPSGARRRSRSPSGARRRSISPSIGRRRSKSPNKERRRSRSPSGARRLSKSPSGVRRWSRSPSGVRRLSKSPSGARRRSISPSIGRRRSKSPNKERRRSKTPNEKFVGYRPKSPRSDGHHRTTPKTRLPTHRSRSPRKRHEGLHSKHRHRSKSPRDKHRSSDYKQSHRERHHHSSNSSPRVKHHRGWNRSPSKGASSPARTVTVCPKDEKKHSIWKRLTEATEGSGSPKTVDELPDAELLDLLQHSHFTHLKAMSLQEVREWANSVLADDLSVPFSSSDRVVEIVGSGAPDVPPPPSIRNEDETVVSDIVRHALQSNRIASLKEHIQAESPITDSIKSPASAKSADTNVSDWEDLQSADPLLRFKIDNTVSSAENEKRGEQSERIPKTPHFSPETDPSMMGLREKSNETAPRQSLEVHALTSSEAPSSSVTNPKKVLEKIDSDLERGRSTPEKGVSNILRKTDDRLHITDVEKRSSLKDIESTSKSVEKRTTMQKSDGVLVINKQRDSSNDAKKSSLVRGLAASTAEKCEEVGSERRLSTDSKKEKERLTVKTGPSESSHSKSTKKDKSGDKTSDPLAVKKDSKAKTDLSEVKKVDKTAQHRSDIKDTTSDKKLKPEKVNSDPKSHKKSEKVSSIESKSVLQVEGKDKKSNDTMHHSKDHKRADHDSETKSDLKQSKKNEKSLTPKSSAKLITLEKSAKESKPKPVTSLAQHQVAKMEHEQSSTPVIVKKRSVSVEGKPPSKMSFQDLLNSGDAPKLEHRKSNVATVVKQRSSSNDGKSYVKPSFEAMLNSAEKQYKKKAVPKKIKATPKESKTDSRVSKVAEKKDTAKETSLPVEGSLQLAQSINSDFGTNQMEEDDESIGSDNSILEMILNMEESEDASTMQKRKSLLDLPLPPVNFDGRFSDLSPPVAQSSPSARIHKSVPSVLSPKFTESPLHRPGLLPSPSLQPLPGLLPTPSVTPLMSIGFDPALAHRRQPVTSALSEVPLAHRRTAPNPTPEELLFHRRPTQRAVSTYLIPTQATSYAPRTYAEHKEMKKQQEKLRQAEIERQKRKKLEEEKARMLAMQKVKELDPRLRRKTFDEEEPLVPGEEDEDKEQEGFASPLVSLYGVVNTAKTGRGYGKQKFKIPKKDVPKSTDTVASPSSTHGNVQVLEDISSVSPCFALNDTRLLKTSVSPSTVVEPVPHLRAVKDSVAGTRIVKATITGPPIVKDRAADSSLVKHVLKSGKKPPDSASKVLVDLKSRLDLSEDNNDDSTTNLHNEVEVLDEPVPYEAPLRRSCRKGRERPLETESGVDKTGPTGSRPKGRRSASEDERDIPGESLVTKAALLRGRAKGKRALISEDDSDVEELAVAELPRKKGRRGKILMSDNESDAADESNVTEAPLTRRQRKGKVMITETESGVVEKPAPPKRDSSKATLAASNDESVDSFDENDAAQKGVRPKGKNDNKPAAKVSPGKKGRRKGNDSAVADDKDVSETTVTDTPKRNRRPSMAAREAAEEQSDMKQTKGKKKTVSPLVQQADTSEDLESIITAKVVNQFKELFKLQGIDFSSLLENMNGNKGPLVPPASTPTPSTSTTLETSLIVKDGLDNDKVSNVELSKAGCLKAANDAKAGEIPCSVVTVSEPLIEKCASELPKSSDQTEINKESLDSSAIENNLPISEVESSRQNSEKSVLVTSTPTDIPELCEQFTLREAPKIDSQLQLFEVQSNSLTETLNVKNKTNECLLSIESQNKTVGVTEQTLPINEAATESAKAQTTDSAQTVCNAALPQEPCAQVTSADDASKVVLEKESDVVSATVQSSNPVDDSTTRTEAPAVTDLERELTKNEANLEVESCIQTISTSSTSERNACETLAKECDQTHVAASEPHVETQKDIAKLNVENTANSVGCKGTDDNSVEEKSFAPAIVDKIATTASEPEKASSLDATIEKIRNEIATNVETLTNAHGNAKLRKNDSDKGLVCSKSNTDDKSDQRHESLCRQDVSDIADKSDEGSESREVVADSGNNASNTVQMVPGDLSNPIPSTSTLTESFAKMLEDAVTSGYIVDLIRKHGKFQEILGTSIEKVAESSKNVEAPQNIVTRDSLEDQVEQVGGSDAADVSSEEVSPPPKKPADQKEETQSQEISSSHVTRKARRITRRGVMRRMRLGLRKSKRLNPLKSRRLIVNKIPEDDGNHGNVELSLEEEENTVRITRSSLRSKDTPTEPEIERKKSRPATPAPQEVVEKKPPRRKMNELDRLHEHLKHAFISNDLMNTSVHRTCRTEHFEIREPVLETGKRLRKKQLPKEKTYRDESSDTGHSRDSSLKSKRVTRRDGSSDTTRSMATRREESSDTAQSRDSSVKSRRRGRDYSSESNSSRGLAESDSSRESSPEGRPLRTRLMVAPSKDLFEEDIKLRTLPEVRVTRISLCDRASQRGRNTARRGKPWRPSSNRLRDVIKTELFPEPERMLRSHVRPAGSEVKDGGSHYSEEELVRHAYSENDEDTKCLLCADSVTLSKMVDHYRSKHPESEVLISRLPIDEATQAIEESKKNEYTLDDIRDIMEPSMYYAPRKQSSLTCRLCKKSVNATLDENLFFHVCGHTGEFRWKCGAANCSVTMLTIEGIRSHVNWRHNAQRKQLQNAATELFKIPKTYGNIFGYLCTKCNYVQALLKNVKAHVASSHNGVADIVKIDLFLKPEETEKMNAVTLRPSSRLAPSPEKSFRLGPGTFSGPSEVRQTLAESPPDAPSNLADDNSSKKPLKRPSDPQSSDTAVENKQRRTIGKRAVAKKKTGPKPKSARPPEPDIPDLPEVPPVSLPPVADPSLDKTVRPRCPVGVAKKSTGKRRQGMKNLRRDEKMLEARMRSITEASKALKGKKRVEEAQERVLIVGSLRVKWKVNGTMIFQCSIENCVYQTSTLTFLDGHVKSHHFFVPWNGLCDVCGSYPMNAPPSAALTMDDAFNHIKAHLDPSWGLARNDTPTETEIATAAISEAGVSEPQVLIVPKPERRSVTPELPPMKEFKADLDMEVSQSEVSIDKQSQEVGAPILKPEAAPTLNNDESASEMERPALEPQILPKMPLLRVRALEGDKLSTHQQQAEPTDLFCAEDAAMCARDSTPPLEDIPVSDSWKITDVVGATKSPQERQALQSFTDEVPPLVKITTPKQVAPSPARPILSPIATRRPPAVPIANAVSPTAVIPDKRPAPNVVYPYLKNARPIAPKPVVTVDLREAQRQLALERESVAEREREKERERERERAIELEREAKSARDAAEAAAAAASIAVSNAPRPVSSELISLGLVVKSNHMLLDMLQDSKLIDLFKCTSMYCSYTCNQPEIFQKHCGLHQEAEKKKVELSNWKLCSYCNETLTNPATLTAHVQNVHGSSEFQCGYCFYRAVADFYVSMHIDRSHPNSPKKIIRCPKVCVAGPIYAPSEPKFNAMMPYICESCKYQCVHPDEFLSHIISRHAAITAFACHICKALSFRSKQLIKHYKIHGFDRYHCGYCSHATDTHEALIVHFSIEHPTKKPCVFARSQPEKEDLSWQTIYKGEQTSFKVRKQAAQTMAPANVTAILEQLASLEGTSEVSQAVLLPNAEFSTSADDGEPAESLPVLENEPIPPVVTRPAILSKSSKLVPLKMPSPLKVSPVSKKPATVLAPRTSDSDSDIEILEHNPSSARVWEEMATLRNQTNESTGLLVDKLVVETLAGNVGGSSAESSPEKATPMEEPSSMPHGRAVEEAVATLNKTLQAEKSAATFVAIDGDDDDDDDRGLEPLVICEEATAPPKKKQKLELSGPDLYKCGNRSCSFKAETPIDLSEHLVKCNLDTILSCRSCNFTTNSTITYLRHLPKHGPKRYSCGVCGMRGIQSGVQNHIKVKHRTASSKVIPVDPIKTDSELDYFILQPVSVKKRVEKPRAAKPKTFSEDRESRTPTPSPAPSPVRLVETPSPIPQPSTPPRDQHTYGPEDEDKLPMPAIYSFEVKCAICSYKNKVRSNMIRHLRLHKDALLRGGVMVPSSAPTNPVPSGPRMFDKMTNLAASSHAGRVPVDKLSALDVAKLPGYVAENRRYKCCAKDCQYITLDKEMLHHHMSALHSESPLYSCPHCPPDVPESLRTVPLDSMGDHLKLHDTKLYKCAHCDMCHFIRGKVERHVSDSHSDKRQFVHTVREPEPEPEVAKAYKCLLCVSFLCASLSEIMKHLQRTHGGKGRFKCRECSFIGKNTAVFGNHFAKCHGSRPIKYHKCYKTVNAPADLIPSEPPPPPDTTTRPLWQRASSGPRTIRGIPIDSETSTAAEPAKKRRMSKEDNQQDLYICKICNQFKTSSITELREHFRSELSYALFTCTICKQQLYSEASANSHAETEHPDTKHVIERAKMEPEIDYWMDRACAKQTNVEDQVLLDKSKKKAKKSDSGSTTKPGEPSQRPASASFSRRCSSSSLDNLPGPSTSGQILCPHCDETDETIHAMKIHIINDHLKLGRYMCSDCNLTFHTESQGRAHVREIHSRVRVYPNPKAEWYQVTEIFWKVHYGLMDPCQTTFRIANYEEKAITCNFSCDVRTIPELMPFHLGAAHRMPEMMFFCDVPLCGLKGKSALELLDHVNERHSWKDTLFRGIVAYDIEFQCDKCSFKTIYEKKLLDHLRTEHSCYVTPRWEVKNKFYVCGYCRMRCSGPEWITNHLQITHKTLAPAARIQGTACLIYLPTASSPLAALMFISTKS